MENKIDLSAIIIYYQKYEYDNIENLFKAYKSNLDKTKLSYEIIVVIDGNMPEVLQEVRSIAQNFQRASLVFYRIFDISLSTLRVGNVASSLAELGLGKIRLVVLFVGIIILVAMDLKSRSSTIEQYFFSKHRAIKWTFYYAIILITILFGVFEKIYWRKKNY